MKSLSSRVIGAGCLWIVVMCLGNAGFGQAVNDPLPVRCATDQVEELRNAANPARRADQIETERAIQEFLAGNRLSMRVSADVIRIPVVVHVIHNQADNRVGGAGNTNISDEQIRSQITVLNEDYRRKAGTNGFNTNPVGVDTQIEFELAPYAPDGRSSTGITRNYSKTTAFSPYTDNQIIAGIVSWPSDRYLNIWVCPLSAGYLGVAQLPSVQGIGGLDNSEKDKDKTDGVIIDYKVFGSVQYMTSTGPIVSNTYNLGRTTTHEVGHWLGLLHTWGKADNVCGTDYCDDTPLAKTGNLTLVCDARYVECSGVTTKVMIENYMDYSPDRCMNIFTRNQLDRMNAVIAVSPRRAALVEAARKGRLEEADKLTVEIFPNPSVDEVFANVRFSSFQSFGVSVYDKRGILMNSVTFNDVWSRKVTVNRAGLQPGVYILKVSTANETVSKPFVIR